MKYEELEECKENEAQKDYEALAQNIIKEVAINLMRVSNVYTDKKYDPYKSYKQVFSYFYGRNEDWEMPNQMKEFMMIATSLSIKNDTFIEFKEELEPDDPDRKTIYKKIIKDIKRLKKELIFKINLVEEA